MKFNWLKRFMPRGIYGRAALILIVPILAIQLVVSTAFIQRHFEDVTRQMTRNLTLEIGLLLTEVAAARSPELALAAARRLGRALGLLVDLPAEPASGDTRLYYDLSGRIVISSLRSAFPQVASVELADLKRVRVTLPTDHGLLSVNFDRRRVSASNPHQLLVLMALAGIVLTLIAFLFLRNQMRPIRRLGRAAEAFGKGQHLSYTPSGAIEVRAAGNAFLSMRSRIERQIEQRTQMLSGVSHDLRTPLTRLRLGLSMLEESEETAAMGRDLDEMQHMLDEFLDFARDGASEGETVPTDPVTLVREVLEDSRRAGHAVILREVSGEGDVPMRPGAVRRAVTNLVGNAARHGKNTEVSVVVLDRSVRISVEDDGPGIAKEDRELAMRPFTRLDSSRNQDKGSGVGLGLAIAADIARNHGGSLRLSRSEALGGLQADLILAR